MAPRAQPRGAPHRGTRPAVGAPLVVRLSRAGRRLRQADRNHPWVLDTAVVLVVFLMFCVPDLVHGGDDRTPRVPSPSPGCPWPGMLALQAGLVLPLLWRRRRPSAAFSAVAAVFLRPVVHWGLAARRRRPARRPVQPGAARAGCGSLPWACAVMVGGTGAGRACGCRSSVSVVGRAVLPVQHRRPRRWPSVWRYGSDGPSSPGCATARPAWRSNATSAAGWPRPPNAPGSPARCTTSSATTCPSSSPSPTAARTPRTSHPNAATRPCSSSATPAARPWANCAACSACCASRRRPRRSPSSARSPASPTSTRCATRVRAAGLQVVYRTTGDLDALDRGVQLTVYRIVQEALTNTLKHAGAGTRVQLPLGVDGRPAAHPGPGHRPVRAARPGPTGRGRTRPGRHAERAALYGGTVTAGPAPGGGWTRRGRPSTSAPTAPTHRRPRAVA